ncbi:hypothetical protein [Paenimyroides baculatum]|uniref:Uncharacterized protein n=1 Tax=Paenimyroides baculatum TaxID=2608000 RepID=A0A5M6CMD2_9FLAO|nr:hypothetical protein [Paenimyroides baculatum]KAA5534299.1 hypothetical protein F0460_09330 [Paenimyroides baculatum]
MKIQKTENIDNLVFTNIYLIPRKAKKSKNTTIQIFANSTIFYANSTQIKVTTTTFGGIDLTISEDVTVNLRDELTDKGYSFAGQLVKEEKAYNLSFLANDFNYKIDNKYEMTIINDSDEVIYNGKLLVTNQQPQKFTYN